VLAAPLQFGPGIAPLIPEVLRTKWFAPPRPDRPQKWCWSYESPHDLGCNRVTIGHKADSPTVSVVVVSHDSRDLPVAVAGIATWAEVVVVEQHPGSTVVEQVRRDRPDATLILAGSNRGFGAGCNLGAANATGDVLVFLNPDATIDEVSLRKLAHSAWSDESGLIGPTILDARGADDTRARNWSSATIDAIHLVFPRRLVPLRLRRDIPPTDPRYRDGGEVPYVQGACMAISRRAFFDAGGFDENFFLYGEEEDLARRLRTHGRTSRLVPTATARHTGGTSTETLGHFATEQLFRAHVVMYRKHVGHAYAWFGATLLATALLVLLATAPVRRHTPWRKRETSAWCRAALRGVIAGLIGRARVTPPPATVSGEPWDRPPIQTTGRGG
jgi:N-acetylglucosaminyl-diphospho-decaprenol L-rhamnosyltransferase